MESQYMPFPITRARMQTFCENELSDIDAQTRKDTVIKQICAGVENTMFHLNSKYMYQPAMHGDLIHGGLTKFGQVQIVRKDILNDVVEHLKQIFINCDVVVDPANTYILIDWS